MDVLEEGKNGASENAGKTRGFYLKMARRNTHFIIYSIILEKVENE